MSAEIEGVKELSRSLQLLSASFPYESRRALSKTAQRAGTRARRDIAKHNGLPQREFRRRVQGYRARFTVEGGQQASVWVGLRKSIPISKIPGARYNMRTGTLQAGKVKSKPFKARMPSGYVGLFVRKPGARPRKRSDGQWTELPIEEPAVRIDPVQASVSTIKHAGAQLVQFYGPELKRLINLRVRRVRLRGT